MTSVRSLIALSSLALLFVAAGCNLESMKQVAESADGPAAVSPAHFEEVTQSDQLTLVKFGATWCGPCVKVDRELAKVESNLEPGVGVLKVDVDANQDLAAQFRISSIPRMMLVRKGEILDDRVGYLSASELTQWIDQHRQ